MAIPWLGSTLSTMTAGSAVGSGDIGGGMTLTSVTIGAGSTLTYDSTIVPPTMTRSMKGVCASGVATYVRISIPATTLFSASWEWYFAGSLPADLGTLAKPVDSAGAKFGTIYVNSGKLVVNDNNNSVKFTSAAVLPVDTWLRIAYSLQTGDGTTTPTSSMTIAIYNATTGAVIEGPTTVTGLAARPGAQVAGFDLGKTGTGTYAGTFYQGMMQVDSTNLYPLPPWVAAKTAASKATIRRALASAGGYTPAGAGVTTLYDGLKDNPNSSSVPDTSRGADFTPTAGGVTSLWELHPLTSAQAFSAWITGPATARLDVLQPHADGTVTLLGASAETAIASGVTTQVTKTLTPAEAANVTDPDRIWLLVTGKV